MSVSSIHITVITLVADVSSSVVPILLIVVLEKFVAKVIAALLKVPERTMSMVCPSFMFCIVNVAVPTLPVNKNVVAADASKF